MVTRTSLKVRRRLWIIIAAMLRLVIVDRGIVVKGAVARYVNSQELSHTSTRHFAIKLGLSRETFRMSQFATLPCRVNEETCNRENVHVLGVPE